MCTVVSALLGYAAPIDASPFRADRDGLSSDTFPRLPFKETGFILLWTWLSSRVRRAYVGPWSVSHLRTRRDRGRLPWGSYPLRDINPASPLPTGIPGPPMFRPQRFSRSRRLTPRCTLQACFILLPRPGFALQGFQSPDSAEPPRRWPVPPRRWHLQPAAGCPTTPATCASTSRS